MKCILKNKINHKNIKEKFKNTLFFCKLFEKQGVGMNQLGIICGACCIRCQQLGDVLADLIRDGAITYEDLERDPERFTQYLSQELTDYAEVVRDISEKSFEEIRASCARCNPLHVKPQDSPKAPATKMKYVGREV